MTTIIIHKGDLYGDRKVMIESLPMSFYDRSKIFTSSCGQFAFALEDPGVDPDNPLPQEKAIRKLLECLVIKPPRSAVAVREVMGITTQRFAEGLSDEEKWLTSDIMVITRTMAFGSRHGRIRELNGRDFGHGADHFTLIGFLHAGRSIEDAYAWIGKNCPMTGGKFDVIRHEELKPFVIQGVS